MTRRRSARPAWPSPKVRNNRRMVGLVLAAGAAALGGSAISGIGAANTVPGRKAGDGQAPILRYTVSGMAFSLNANSPMNLDNVTFNLSTSPPAGTTIKVKAGATGAWYPCTFVGVAVSCNLTSPQATAMAATTIRVVAAS